MLPRILMIAPHFPPEGGAGAVRLGSLAAELARLGHEVDVVAPGDGTSPAVEQSHRLRIMRVRVARRRRGALGNAFHQLALRVALGRAARGVVAERAPGVVLCSSPPPLAALAGGAASRQAGCPLVLDVRDIWPDVLIEARAFGPRSPAAVGLRWIENRLLRHAAALTTVTMRKLQRLGARTTAPVHLVPNGVDAAWAEGGPAYAGGGVAGPFDVLYAGNIGRAQDVPLLARAVAAAASHAGRDRARPLRAVIVGDGEERDAVARVAATSDAVLVLPPEGRSAVRDRLSCCGCAFVSLRTSAIVDAVPSKMLEAMARGVPVVLAAAGEAASLLEAADAGIVVPPGEGGRLLEAIERMAGLSPDERRAMGRRGRDFVLSRFRREDAAREMSRVLCGVAGPAAGAAS